MVHCYVGKEKFVETNFENSKVRKHQKHTNDSI